MHVEVYRQINEMKIYFNVTEDEMAILVMDFSKPLVTALKVLVTDDSLNLTKVLL